MFPLAHNYMAERMLTAQVGPFAQPCSILEQQLIYVGSILPDFICGMGFDRNIWHSQSADFQSFCQGKGPLPQALALGVRLHGDDGFGFDTYADEVWQGKMGWCFLKCLPYIPDAVLACNLPRKFALWKAHNLVELAAELELAEAYPHLGPRLLAAVHTTEVMDILGQALAEYAGTEAEPPRMRSILQTMNQRFDVQETTAAGCAAKYLQQLNKRHQISGGSQAALAELPEQIRADLKEELWQWFDEVFNLLKAKWTNEHSLLTI